MELSVNERLNQSGYHKISVGAYLAGYNNKFKVRTKHFTKTYSLNTNGDLPITIHTHQYSKSLNAALTVLSYLILLME